MKRLGLFWKITIILGTVSFTVVLVYLCCHWYNLRFGTFPERYSYSDACEGILYRNGQVRILDTRTNKTTTPRLDKVVLPDYGDSITVFIKDRKRGYLNIHTCGIIIPEQYDHAWKFSEGLAAVIKDDKIGFIGPRGEQIIPFQYPAHAKTDTKVGFQFKRGLCIMIGNSKKFGLIDKSGAWKLAPEYDEISDLYKGFRVLVKDSSMGVMDSLFHWIIPMEKAWMQVNDNGLVVLRNNNQQLYAFDGKTVLQPFLYDNTDVLKYNSGRIDPDGSEIYEMSEYITFQVHYKWGLMNKTGKIVIQPIFDDVIAMNKDLFSCKMGSNWITVNTSGKVINGL